MNTNFILLTIAAFLIFEPNPVEKEIKEIFYNIGMDDKPENIIDQSELEFQYEKDTLPFDLGFDEIWTAKIIDHEKFKTDIEKIEIELHRSQDKKTTECYDLILRVRYSKTASLTADYNKLVARFEKLDTDIEKYAPRGRDFPFLLNHSLIKLGKDMKNAELKFGMIQIEEEPFNKKELSISFDKCPS